MEPLSLLALVGPAIAVARTLGLVETATDRLLKEISRALLESPLHEGLDRLGEAAHYDDGTPRRADLLREARSKFRDAGARPANDDLVRGWAYALASVCSHSLGDKAEAERAAEEARRLASSGARSFAESHTRNLSKQWYALQAARGAGRVTIPIPDFAIREIGRKALASRNRALLEPGGAIDQTNQILGSIDELARELGLMSPALSRVRIDLTPTPPRVEYGE